MQIMLIEITVVLIVVKAADMYAMLCISPGGTGSWNMGIVMTEPWLLRSNSLVRGPDPEMGPL